MTVRANASYPQSPLRNGWSKMLGCIGDFLSSLDTMGERRMRLTLSIVALLMFTTGPASAAQAMPRYGVFIYSDLCVGRQSGDPSGFRVTLIREGDGDRLEFEWTEGPLYGGPGYGVKLDPNTQRLTFSVNMNVAGGAEDFQDYSAEISDDELVLNSTRGHTAFHLPRVRDLSRKPQPCQL